MSSRKKKVEPKSPIIPGTEIMPPTCMPSRPETTLAPIKTFTAIMPANGLIVDNNAAVSYIASIRRRQLRNAKDECEESRKAFKKKLVDLDKEIQVLCKAHIEGEQDSWIKALNTVFDAQKVPFEASVSVDHVGGLTEKDEFKYTRKILNSAERKGYHGGYDPFTEEVTINASEEIIQLFEQVKDANSQIDKISSIEVKIQREIQELHHTAMETQAAIFAQTMQSDDNGKAILAALNAKIAEMPQMPAIPSLKD